MHKQTRNKILLLLGVLSLILAACTPTTLTPNRIDNSRQVQAPALFYPEREGFNWTHTKADGSETKTTLTGRKGFPLDGRAYETITRVDGDSTTTWYFQRSNSGVNLAGFIRDDYALRYDPPIQILPNERAFTVGREWSGSTSVTEIIDYGTRESKTIPWDVTYQHEIVERQNIRSGTGIYDAYKLRYSSDWRTEHDILGKNQQIETWFAPFIGTIRTPEGHTLTDTNINTPLHTQTP